MDTISVSGDGPSTDWAPVDSMFEKTSRERERERESSGEDLPPSQKTANANFTLYL